MNCQDYSLALSLPKMFIFFKMTMGVWETHLSPDYSSLSVLGHIDTFMLFSGAPSNRIEISISSKVSFLRGFLYCHTFFNLSTLFLLFFKKFIFYLFFLKILKNIGDLNCFLLKNLYNKAYFYFL